MVGGHPRGFMKMSKLELEQLAEIFQETHEYLGQVAARSINTSLVVRNWLYGWYIVEFENAAAGRSKIYGKALLDNLSQALAQSGIKGISPTNLRKFRQFYQVFQISDELTQTLIAISQKLETPTQKIQQTVSVESFSTLLTEHSLQLNGSDLYTLLAGQFHLSWSHYVELLTVDNDSERRFYEIEARENSWSLRELKRQMGSSLYQRLALSRNAEEIRQLAEQGLVVEKAADIIKNPLVLYF